MNVDAALARNLARATHGRPVSFALLAAARGWSVFPVVSGDKRPAVRDWEGEATTDVDLIRGHWARRPAANVGIACGPSRLMVVDLDVPKPGQVPPPELAELDVRWGLDTLTVLAHNHGQALPLETFTVRTGRGGLHLYFTAPERVQLRNTSGRDGGGLGWMIDTRANGGFVVGPGSRVDQPDGAGRYTVIDRTDPAPLPDWLTRLLTPTPAPTRPAGGWPWQTAQLRDVPAYAAAALRREAEQVADTKPGARHHTLNRAAFSLGTLVGAGTLPREAVEDALRDAALAANRYGDPNTVREINAIIRSGLTAGMARPRTTAA
ncbi:bifunctional DNA primase/polymerase [Allonocardiopsis opalescens]|uniref:Bifunctional DNA primase/polymerase-like protein n=1 Tax=Allonocardiopsis opalescens TaxID=1144618 RepID=A0A2T0Q9E9_9ACTN|nr:bifunctional DNA primase/polymerase [Allonocardiopsis opalescens]PRY00431.1 bifunctional DNA primase/polymerase-like protein [Allonocardiopsis opalescens]